MEKEVEFIEVDESKEYHDGQVTIFVSIWIGIVLLVLFNLDKIVELIKRVFDL